METTTTTTTDPMAATNENPFGSYAFENSNQDHFNGMNGTTTNTMNNNKFIDEPAFDGNENLLNFESQTTTITKGVIDADDLMNENNLVQSQGAGHGFDNEFGPETDVDAVDESMLMSSPHSVSQEDDQMLGKEFQQFEPKEIDFTEATAPSNPFGGDFVHHELQQPEHVTIEDDNSHSENDKSAAEQEYEAFLKHTAGQLSNEERNVFGLPKEVLGGADEDVDKVIESSAVDEANESAIVADYDEDDEEAPAKGESLLIGDVDEGAAESVVATGATGVDSEAESDDEWNYVKPGADKEAEDITAPVGEEEEPALEKPEDVVIDDEKKNFGAEEDELLVPQSPSIQEQHGEAQALAEAQEHCVELNIGHSEVGVGDKPDLLEEDQLLQPEPVAPEQAACEEIVNAASAAAAAVEDHLLSSPETPESTSLLSVDTTEADQQECPINIGVGGPEAEDMSSQLNPDAQEFVPLSPQGSAPVSPALKMDLDDHFIGLQQPQIAAIVEEDRILAQSPRKNNGNTIVLDNAAIPDEREFDEEISRRPHEWSGDLLGNGKAEGELNGSFVATNGDAAESSSQDMIVVDDDDSVALNSKEERDLDEEKEDCVKELRDDKIKEIIDNIPEAHDDEHNGKSVPGEEDPMNMSFHQDVHVAPSANPFDMNAVHLLPTEDLEEEENSEYSEKPEADTQMAVEQRMAELNLSSSNTERVPEESPLPESQQESKQMELTESESNFYMQQPEEEPERKEFDEKDEEEHVIKAAEAEAVQEIPLEASPVDVKAETPPPTPAAVNDRDLLQAASPEPQMLMEAVEKLVEEAPKAVEEAPKEESDPISIGGALAVGVAVAGVAAAATAVAATKDKPAAKKTTATTPAKKEVPAKPKTPASLAVKASSTTRTTPTRTSTSSATKVSSVSKASPVAAKTATTPRSKVGAAATTPTASKASPTTTRSPLVEKKSLAPTAAKRTTPSRPATTSSLSGASPKTTTPSRLTSASSAKTPTSATTARTSTSATSRLSATKTTTATAPAGGLAAKKSTPTGGVASRTLVSKTSTTTTAAAAPRPRPTSGTTSSSLTTTTVKKTTTTTSSSLTAKPKTTTTTTTTSRLMNGTAAAKAPTAASRVSATKTTPTTAKAPLSARPASSTTTTTTTTSTAAKKPIPGSASARAKAVSAPRPMAAKRTAAPATTTTTALKGSKPSPITKRNIVTTETTTTTVVVEKSLMNGDAPVMSVTSVTKDAELIVNGNGDGHDVVLNGNGPVVEGEQKMVIDLTAD